MVLVGTGMWGLASVVLLLVNLMTDFDVSIWLWTGLAGTVLGLLGYGVLRWQRAAARSGSRSAQTGV
ncbi:putative DUF2530 family protein [Actinoalloteichus sp. GBA129-24]|uniref:DUF2530 family protein n=1 Tax=Actinoalloteichus fjordicus TaxID=1612552 RepID=A0AAC9LHG6_9PSEU|nr:putative DUF2530 family protein [Actinoalloteichus fjordicus]APU23744.1 putative DUF2530 family protein [Actinoalloteichus sp. GBA129-24]